MVVVDVPVTVVVEIVILCSCVERAEALRVSPVACLMLSLAEVDSAPWAVKPEVTDPEMIGIPPETVPVMLN